MDSVFLWRCILHDWIGLDGMRVMIPGLSIKQLPPTEKTTVQTTLHYRIFQKQLNTLTQHHAMSTTLTLKN